MTAAWFIAMHLRRPDGVGCVRCDSDKVSEFITNETTRDAKKSVPRSKCSVTVRDRMAPEPPYP